MNPQGRLVISNDTKTESLSEKGDRKHKFIVTCGKTGKQYEISADDNRTRNEWLLDIGKVSHDLTLADPILLFFLYEMAT